MTHPSSTSNSSTSSSLWSRPGRLVVAVTFAAVGLAACGGGDGGPVAAPDPTSAESSGPVAAPSETDATATGAESGSGSSGEPTGPTVVATIPPSLPEQLVGEVGVVEVIGEPLPAMARGASIESDPGRGKKAPVLVGTTFADEPIRIDPVATGRPTLVVFLAHWCPHCNNEIPVINDLRDSNAFLPTLDIYGVSTGIDANAPNFPPSQWIKDRDWTYPTMRDGLIGEGKQTKYLAHDAYGSGGYPMAVLLNADGTVAARWSGEAGGEAIISNIETYLAF